MNNIRKNKAAIVVIVALMILPSMYAWFNIVPSWDPYSNTEGVAVAVANKDEGAEVEGKKLNVGDEIILSLLDNKKLGWKFVDEEEALKGVEHGDYYASIIIPENFSENLASVLDDEPQKPVLDYYINEKINAIAPKVTSAGASGIVESIRSGFVKVANEAIFTAFNDVGIELETNRAAIERLRDSIYRMEEDLPEIEHLLATADTDLVKVGGSIGKVNDGVTKAEEISKEAEKMSKRLEEMLRESDKTVRTYVPLVKQDLRIAQTVIQQIPTITNRMSKKGEDVNRLLDKVVEGTGKIDDSTATLKTLADLLEKTDERLTGDRKLEDLIDRLNSESDKMSELKDSIESAIKTLEKGDHLGVDVVENIDGLANDVDEQLKGIIEIYEDTIIPEIKNKIKLIEDAGERVPVVLGEVKEKNKDLMDMLENRKPMDLEGQKAMIQKVYNVTDSIYEALDPIVRITGGFHDLPIGDFFSKTYPKLKEIHDAVGNVRDLSEDALSKIQAGEEISEKFFDVLAGALQQVDDSLDKVIGDKLPEIAEDFDKTIKHLEKEEEAIRTKLNDLKDASETATDLTNRLVEAVENPEKTLEVLRDMNVRIKDGQVAIASIVQSSERLQKTFDDGLFLDGVDRIESLKTDLQSFKSDILRVVASARDSKKSVGEALDYIEDQSRDMDKAISDIILFIDRELMPKYEKASDKATDALSEGNKMLTKAGTYFPRVQELLEKVDEGVDKGKDGLAKANEAFPEAKEKVTEIAKRVRILEEKGDLDQIINLMKNDPDAESDFFSDPIVLSEHELFPIPNYGSAMGPFFTAMSLWVGGLILVSSLIVDVPNKERYKSYETYFGRILTFWIIGLAQAFIVTMGNMILLKTFVAHKMMFVLFGFLISIVFVTIIYTLVSVFGNTGKVISIVLLVMQLGASGGTFPIQMTPVFFQKIHNFLPFTHALGLFRESVGGIIWPVVFKHIAWLFGYMVLFLFIGIKLKARINKSSDKFLADARESEIIL